MTTVPRFSPEVFPVKKHSPSRKFGVIEFPRTQAVRIELNLEEKLDMYSTRKELATNNANALRISRDIESVFFELCFDLRNNHEKMFMHHDGTTQE
jgi:hypothetical protein